MPAEETGDALPSLRPRKWQASAFRRWGQAGIAAVYIPLGVLSVLHGSDSVLLAWSWVVMGVCFLMIAINAWREPIFEITEPGVRWPGSKGVIPWSQLKTPTVPPEDGWTHTVFLDAEDGRQRPLPKMERVQLEALAERIRQARDDAGPGGLVGR